MIWSYELPEHKDIKSELISLIDKTRGESINNKSDNIIKTDYYLNNGMDRFHFEYFNVLHKFISECGFYEKLLEVYYVDGFGVSQGWYQQYNTGDTHGWHIHPKTNISAVYCLELEDSNDSTEFMNYDKGGIFKTESKEGDIIVFPSYIMHRAPVVKSNTRKTTINFNIDLGAANPRLIKNFFKL